MLEERGEMKEFERKKRKEGKFGGRKRMKRRKT